MKNQPLLQEAGVTITPTHFTTPSHTFAFRDIKRVSVRNPSPSRILQWFLKEQHQVLINDFEGEHLAFQTKDGALARRIKDALARAAGGHVDNKKVVWNK